MQEIIAPVADIKFDIEIALEQQIGSQPLPFPGMDKSGAAICTFTLISMCNKGTACPFRHVKGDRSVVCKHWLRGLCKKGDDCEFLHEYDMSKMPECFFYSKFGQCSNKDCPFLHIDPENKIKDCPWYDRGFCRHAHRLTCQRRTQCSRPRSCPWCVTHVDNQDTKPCNVQTTTTPSLSVVTTQCFRMAGRCCLWTKTDQKGVHWSKLLASSAVKRVTMPINVQRDTWLSLALAWRVPSFLDRRLDTDQIFTYDV